MEENTEPVEGFLSYQISSLGRCTANGDLVSCSLLGPSRGFEG